MQRKVLAIFLIFGFTVSFSSPANAIFGLSTCEKVKNQILSEEKVSIILYDLAKKYRDEAIKDGSVTWGEYAGVYEKDILGRQSDIKVFDIMIKNSACYSTEINAYVRTYKQDSQTVIKTYQSVIDGIQKKNWTYLEDARLLDVLKKMSWGFVSVYDKNFLKKMNK